MVMVLHFLVVGSLAALVGLPVALAAVVVVLVQ